MSGNFPSWFWFPFRRAVLKLEGVHVPVDRKVEIDLVVLRGEKLVFVECKEDDNVLNDPENASEFAVQLGELVEVAEHFGEEQILLTTPTCFPADKSSLIDRIPKNSQVSIVWLDGEHFGSA